MMVSGCNNEPKKKAESIVKEESYSMVILKMFLKLIPMRTLLRMGKLLLTKPGPIILGLWT